MVELDLCPYFIPSTLESLELKKVQLPMYTLMYARIINGKETNTNLKCAGLTTQHVTICEALFCRAWYLFPLCAERLPVLSLVTQKQK